MLGAGELVPHFDVTDVTRGRVVYAEHIWQRRNLVLVTVASGSCPIGHLTATELAVLRQRLLAFDAELVVTCDCIEGGPREGLLIADQWGQVAFVDRISLESLLNDPSRIVEWVEYLQRVCPECEGERK